MFPTPHEGQNRSEAGRAREIRGVQGVADRLSTKSATTPPRKKKEPMTNETSLEVGFPRAKTWMAIPRTTNTNPTIRSGRNS